MQNFNFAFCILNFTLCYLAGIFSAFFIFSFATTLPALSTHSPSFKVTIVPFALVTVPSVLIFTPLARVTSAVMALPSFITVSLPSFMVAQYLFFQEFALADENWAIALAEKILMAIKTTIVFI